MTKENPLSVQARADGTYDVNETIAEVTVQAASGPSATFYFIAKIQPKTYQKDWWWELILEISDGANVVATEAGGTHDNSATQHYIPVGLMKTVQYTATGKLSASLRVYRSLTNGQQTQVQMTDWKLWGEND